MSKNTFYKLNHTDPHKAVSFDKLHGYDSGLFGDHLWPETTRIIKNIGRPAINTVDQQ